MSSNSTNPFLLKIIEVHERCWGTEKYTDRPTLQAMLNARIVAVWYSMKKHHKKCFVITIHEDINEIETYFTKVVMAYGKQPPERRLRSLFVDNQQVKVAGVSLILDSVATYVSDDL